MSLQTLRKNDSKEINNMECLQLDWDVINAISTALMAFLTLLTLGYSKVQLNEMRKQWSESNRARLTFSIISWNGLFLLKISNVGKELAYDINVKFNDDFIEGLNAKYTKETFENLQQNLFCIESGASKYYDISSKYSERLITTIGSESFNSNQIKNWLDENINRKITIKGKYCKRYSIDECFSISDFVNRSTVVVDDATLAFQRIQEGVSVRNDNYYPIQKSLDILAKSVQKLIEEFRTLIKSEHDVEL